MQPKKQTSCPCGGRGFRLLGLPKGLAETNTTPAQLLAEYRRQPTNGWIVVVDEPRNELRLQFSPLEKIRRWLKQKLGW